MAARSLLGVLCLLTASVSLQAAGGPQSTSAPALVIPQNSTWGTSQGPQLAVVPAPSPSAVPAWPALRHARPLHLMLIVSTRQELGAYLRIARRANAVLDTRYATTGDVIYHVNDKWIEPKDNPTSAELDANSRMVILDSLRAAVPGNPDAILCDAGCGMLASPDFAAAALAYVQAGGQLVVMGNFYPDPNDNPLAPHWPAKPGKGSAWMHDGAARAEGPYLAGVPVDRLTGGPYIPVPVPTAEANVLASGQAGAMFLSTVGKGAILYCPTGPMSRAHDLFTNAGLAYDHDEIWLRAWDQVLHEMCMGPAALPAYADLRGEPNAPPATGLAHLKCRLVNRANMQHLTASVHVTRPDGNIVYQTGKRFSWLVYSLDASLDILTTQGQGFLGDQLDFNVPISPSWPAGLYPVYLTLRDANDVLIHQAMDFIQVAGTVKLAAAAGQRGYKTGDTAEINVTASSAQPWSGKIVLGVYDFRGRLLGFADKAAELGSGDANFVLPWPVVDHGVTVNSYRVVVAAVKDGAAWARAETTFQRYDPWSMRNEYQWSTWAGIACHSPSTILPAMRLMAHAGMNALGYPGSSGISFPAERWGWRYYNEGIGINTWSPVIEYENDAEMLAQVAKEAAKKDSPELTSGAFVLASVGEEAGFKTGWGHTYYWDTPIAPDKSCRALQWYLKERYATLDKLNATWRTGFKSWDDVKLTREFSGKSPKLETDGWAHPKDSPMGEGVTSVSLAPYADTQNFYAWYYDRFVAAAIEVFRQKINPVARTMASAPSSWIFNSRRCDVRLASASGWDDSQWNSLERGPEPSFSIVWGHFDWSVKTENIFWDLLLQRNGHNNYWVDVPLMFNNDLTHTRASLAMRRWTAQLAGHERIILDSLPAASDVGVMEPSGIATERVITNMAASLKVALAQGGFEYQSVEPNSLGLCRIVFAVGRWGVSAEDASKLDAFVIAGGTLVMTPGFASQDEFGAPQETVPWAGLAARWGLKVLGKIHPAPKDPQELTAPLDNVDANLKGFAMPCDKDQRQKIEAGADWQTQAAYNDGTPAVLVRDLGKGRLVYLNAAYASHHYIQWVTPTGADRQGFFKFIEAACEKAGAHRTLHLDGDLNQSLHLAVKQFTDLTGSLRYIIVRTNGEGPWTHCRLDWLGKGTAVYDVLNHVRYDTHVPLDLRPGEGRLLAVTAAPVKEIKLDVASAGSALRVTAHIFDDAGKAVAGRFPLEIRVQCDKTPLPALARSVSLADGESTAIQIAPGDPAGTWTVTAADGVTDLTARTSVAVSPQHPFDAPALASLGWPSEIAEPARMADAEFIHRLEQLAQLYRTDQGDKGWMTKQILGANYCIFPNTRHSLLRPLYDLDWEQYVPAMRQAVLAGKTIVLTGEDVNVDPATGESTYPHFCGSQLTALAEFLKDANWSLATADGDTLTATLGSGHVILCRESIDAAGYSNPQAAAWQKRWLGELAAAKDLPAIKTKDWSALYDWWSGASSATTAPRTVSWLSGNARELKLTVDANKPLDSVFVLTLPPTGDLSELKMNLRAAGTGTLFIDVGCQGTSQGQIALTAPAADPNAPIDAANLLDWPTAVASYLAARKTQGGPPRDGSRWRLIPVRLTCDAHADVTVGDVRLTVK